MTLLDSLIERLNAAIERNNARLDRAIECGEVAPEDAPRFRVIGTVTREAVRQGASAWPAAWRRALRSILAIEAPDEIIRMCDTATEKTEIIKHLRQGSLKAKGMKPGPMRGAPVAIRLLDMAHLVAHSDAGKAVLLG